MSTLGLDDREPGPEPEERTGEPGAQRRRRRGGIARRLTIMLVQPEPAEMAFLVALVFAAFVYLPLRLTFGTGVGQEYLELAPAAAPAVRVADVDPDGSLRLPTPPYARPVQAGPGLDERRNLFDYKPWPTRPPTPTPTPRPTPVPTPRPSLAPTPTPYSAPFSLVGFCAKADRRIAFLKANDEVFVALEGDVLTVKSPDGKVEKHRVKKVGIESVELGPLEFEASVVLRTGS